MNETNALLSHLPRFEINLVIVPLWGGGGGEKGGVTDLLEKSFVCTLVPAYTICDENLETT